MAAAPALVEIALVHRAIVGGKLDRVGMTEIELPVRIASPAGVATGVPARVDAFVSRDDADAKGIHMSRLFLLAQETLETLVRSFVASHADNSRSAQVDVRFESLLKRPALPSGFRGWRSYPVQMSATLERGRLRSELRVRVTDSSTCPLRSNR